MQLRHAIAAGVAWLVLAGAIGQAEAPLSEIDRLKIEVLTTKAQLVRAIADGDGCRAELGPLRTRLNAGVMTAETDKLAAELEAAHPGYRVNRTTWTLEPVKPVILGRPMDAAKP